MANPNRLICSTTFIFFSLFTFLSLTFSQGSFSQPTEKFDLLHRPTSQRDVPSFSPLTPFLTEQSLPVPHFGRHSPQQLERTPNNSTAFRNVDERGKIGNSDREGATEENQSSNGTARTSSLTPPSFPWPNDTFPIGNRRPEFLLERKGNGDPTNDAKMAFSVHSIPTTNEQQKKWMNGSGEEEGWMKNGGKDAEGRKSEEEQRTIGGNRKWETNEGKSSTEGAEMKNARIGDRRGKFGRSWERSGEERGERIYVPRREQFLAGRRGRQHFESSSSNSREGQGSGEKEWNRGSGERGRFENRREGGRSVEGRRSPGSAERPQRRPYHRQLRPSGETRDHHRRPPPSRQPQQPVSTHHYRPDVPNPSEFFPEHIRSAYPPFAEPFRFGIGRDGGKEANN